MKATLARARALIKEHRLKYAVGLDSMQPTNLFDILSGRNGDNINARTRTDAKVIELNPKMIERYPIPKLWENTILHEIAHAIVDNLGLDPGIDGHGQNWKEIAASIGCDEPECRPGPTYRRLMNSYDIAHGRAPIFSKEDLSDHPEGFIQRIEDKLFASSNRTLRPELKKAKSLAKKHEKVIILGASLGLMAGLVLFKLDQITNLAIMSTSVFANARLLDWI